MEKLNNIFILDLDGNPIFNEQQQQELLNIYNEYMEIWEASAPLDSLHIVQNTNIINKFSELKKLQLSLYDDYLKLPYNDNHSNRIEVIKRNISTYAKQSFINFLQLENKMIRLLIKHNESLEDGAKGVRFYKENRLGQNNKTIPRNYSGAMFYLHEKFKFELLYLDIDSNDYREIQLIFHNTVTQWGYKKPKNFKLITTENGLPPIGECDIHTLFESRYMPYYNDSIFTTNLTKIGKMDSDIKATQSGNSTTYIINGDKYKLNGIKELSLGAIVLFRTGLSRLAQLNHGNKGDIQTTEIKIPLDEYLDSLEKNYGTLEDNGDNDKILGMLKNDKKKIRKELKELENVRLTFSYSGKNKAKKGNFHSIPLVGANGIDGSGLHGSYITISFEPKLAKYIGNSPLGYYDTLQNKLKNKRTWSIADKLGSYYFMYNKSKEFNNIISLKSLLEASTLPKYEELKNRHWYDKIILPCIDSLDELKKTGILKDYRLVYAKGKEIPDNDYYDFNYTDYIEKVYVKFEKPDAPSNEERKQAREKRIEAAQKKKTKKITTKTATEKAPLENRLNKTEELESLNKKLGLK